MSPIDHTLYAAKAYCALIGSVLTAVVTSVPHVPTWVGIATAVATAVGTFVIPNASKEQLQVRKGSKVSPYAMVPKDEGVPKADPDAPRTNAQPPANNITPDAPPVDPAPPAGPSD